MKKTLLSCIVIIALLVSMTGCGKTGNVQTAVSPGGPAYVIDVFIIDGVIWCLRADPDSADGLINLNTVDAKGKETLVRSFQWGAQPVYSPSLCLFFFIENDSLCFYDPYSGGEQIICELGEKSKFVSAVAGKYILITNAGVDTPFGPGTLVDFFTKEVSEASGFYRGPTPILGTYENKIIHWSDPSKSINMYDCATGSSVELYKKDPKSTDIISRGCMVNKSLYFVEGEPNGTLKVIDNIFANTGMNAKQVEGANLNIVDVAHIDGDLICAVRERSGDRSPISFYSLSPFGTFTKLVSWDDSNYWSLGSLRTTAVNGYLAACITSQSGIFVYDLNNEKQLPGIPKPSAPRPSLQWALPPAVFVNDKYYQAFEGRQQYVPHLDDNWVYLGDIRSAVPGYESPTTNFQANQDIIGAEIYHAQEGRILFAHLGDDYLGEEVIGDSIIVVFEGQRSVYISDEVRAEVQKIMDAVKRHSLLVDDVMYSLMATLGGGYSSLNDYIFLGEVRSAVSLYEFPTENLQANRDIVVGAKVYKLPPGDTNDIVVISPDGTRYCYKHLSG